MSVELPSELVWVLGAIGVVWPSVDEDTLRSIADGLRDVVDELEDKHARTAHAVDQMLEVNSADSLEIFQTLWRKSSARYLKDLGEGIKVLAEAVSVGADIIEGMKVAAVAEIAAFAAQSAAVAAESIATFGLGAGMEAVVVQATRAVVKGIIDQAIAQVEHQLKQAMTEPVVAVLAAAAEHLGGQLLGDAAGVRQGIDLSGLGAAATSGADQAVSTLAGRLRQTVAGPAGALSKISDVLSGGTR